MYVSRLRLGGSRGNRWQCGQTWWSQSRSVLDPRESGSLVLCSFPSPYVLSVLGERATVLPPLHAAVTPRRSW
jgi:hypothetical protein